MDPSFNQSVLLLKDTEKKGGWTYIFIPLEGCSIPLTRYGVRKVNGTLDDYVLKDFTMWTLKNKGHYLAVKADIRKQIGKEAGDSVQLVLVINEPQTVIPEDFLDCLREDPKVLAYFQKLPGKEKQTMTDWIFSAKTEDDKIARIVETMKKLESKSAK